jgi:hypothetical protein
MNPIPESQTTEKRSLAKWAALVNDTQIAVPDPTVSEHVLRTQAGVPAEFVIVRDHNSPDDVVVKPGEIVDLRSGNVFYTVCTADVGNRGACTAPAKRAIFVDDRAEEIGTPHQTGGSIRELFELSENVMLFRDLHSPNDQPIEANAAANFDDGPVFLTRKVKRQVQISINGEKRETHSGQNSVKHLRAIGNVPPDEILSQLKDGKPEDLPDDGYVEIHGGEVFVSHPPSTGSSK